MDEIRNSKFDISDKTVNGFVAIALQLNSKLQEMDLDEVIELEEKEYKNILEELDNLDLLNDEDSLPLDGEDYLIFKLEKDLKERLTRKNKRVEIYIKIQFFKLNDKEDGTLTISFHEAERPLKYMFN